MIIYFFNLCKFFKFLSVSDFYFYSIVVGEQTLNDGPDFPGNITLANDSF